MMHRYGFRSVAAGVVLALLTALVAVRPAEARSTAALDTWAAVAYSQKTGRYGYGNNYFSKAEAQKRALAECKADDAKVVGTVGNGWVALALGDDKTAYGYCLAATAFQARSIALAECRKRTKNCAIVVCVLWP